MQNIILYFGQQELKKKICTRGGTGRRARFRSVWINLRGSSNLLACTMGHGTGIGIVFFYIPPILCPVISAGSESGAAHRSERRCYMTKNKKVENNPRITSDQKTHNKILKIFYLLLRVSVIGILIAQFFNRNFENVMLCVLTLILFAIPALIERRLKIEIPDTLEIIILLFIYAAEILGEIRSFYTAFPGWDTMLHTMNGFLCAAIGFSMIDILNRNDRFKFYLSPVYLALFAFCFSMTVGVIWEFFEFGMDHFFGADMQKDTIIQSFNTVLLDPAKGTTPVTVSGISDVILVKSDGTQMALGLGGYVDIGIIDTMSDLFVNFIGAVVFSFLGFLYIKGRGKGSFVRRFIPSRVSEDIDSCSDPEITATETGKKQPETENTAPDEEN